MVAIADAFRIGVMASKRCTNRAIGTMGQTGHAVIGVGETLGTIGQCQHRCFISGIGVADGDTDVGRCAIPGQREILVMFRCQSDDLDQVASRFLILLEFFHRTLDDVFFRLGTLVFDIEVRTFEVDTDDLGAFRIFLLDFRNLGNRLL